MSVGGLLFAAAILGVVSSSDLPGTAPLAAQSTDTYKSVYDGWKWWHVYCYRCLSFIGRSASTLGPADER